MGVALGVVLGSIMQLLVSSIGLIGLGFDYQFKIYWRNKGFRKVLSLLPARSLDQGMDYVVGIVESNLASRMASGTVRAYEQAAALHMMPVNLVGVAISTAVFPSLTERLNEDRKDLFRKELQQAIRVMAWIAIPIAVITFFARGYVVSFIKNGGDSLMAGILGALVIAILFRTMYHIASRSFYAQQDTRTPFYVSIFAIGLNIILAIWFTQSLDLGAYGLAYAQSIVAVVEVVLLLTIIHKRIDGGLIDKILVSSISRMASAAGFMALVTYATVQLLQLQKDDMSLSSTVPKFTAIVLISAIVYVLISAKMGLHEADIVIKRANKIIFSKRR